MIAGGLPPQYLTYEADTRSENEIRDDFYHQAKILNPYVDFFYFDVLSSVKEFKIAIECIKEFNKPVLIGLYFNDNVCLTSGDTIENIAKNIMNYNCCGIIAACTSPETADLVLPEFKKTIVL